MGKSKDGGDKEGGRREGEAGAGRGWGTEDRKGERGGEGGPRLLEPPSPPLSSSSSSLSPSSPSLGFSVSTFVGVTSVSPTDAWRIEQVDGLPCDWKPDVGFDRFPCPLPLLSPSDAVRGRR